MHKQDNSGEAATTKVWVYIAVGIAIAMIAALQLTGAVVKVEFKPHGIAEFDNVDAEAAIPTPTTRKLQRPL